ncbi:MAG TPA: hypothetical protein VMA83_09110 [Solirubrobacteraceae bacterium]|nr:hypothetical protein [Solirubrobacteraceae bacterium]
MHRIRLFGLAFIAVVGFAATSAAGADAKTVLTLSDAAGKIGTGDVITLESTDLKAYTEAGIWECEHNELPIGIGTNGAAKDTGLSGEEHSYGEFDGIPGACQNTDGIPLLFQADGFPWKAKFTVRAGVGEMAETGTKRLTLIQELVYPELGEKNKCEYEFAKLVSSFAVNSTPQPLVLETREQEYKLNSKYRDTASVCPKSGQLTALWTVTDVNGVVSVLDSLAP